MKKSLAVAGAALAVAATVAASTAAAHTILSGVQTQSPQAGGNEPGKGFTWIDPQYVGDKGSNQAQVSTALTGPTRYLLGSHFAYTIPTTATVRGIEVQMHRGVFNGHADDLSVRLLVNGQIVGTNHSRGARWPASTESVTFGGPSDLWGLSLTPAELDSSRFGVAVQARVTDAWALLSVNHMTVTVYYTP